jgi:hypothetical protein
MPLYPIPFGMKHLLVRFISLIDCLPQHIEPPPFTKLLNKTPNYRDFKVFGCLYFPYLRPCNDHKFQPRSLLCVFIGYALSQKDYKCLKLSSQRVFASRHVPFHEVQFPFKTNSTPEPSNSTFPK